MASGIDIHKYPHRMVSAMVSQKLDSELADYYKLLAIIHAITGNVEKANDCIKEYIRVALPEISEVEDNKKSKQQEILDSMDKWLLKIDPNSVPREKKGFVKRDKPIDFTPKRKRRKNK